jgi:hypothetical protein
MDRTPTNAPSVSLCFLRKERSDRRTSRLTSEGQQAIIEAAINKIYLKAEQPHVARRSSKRYESAVLQSQAESRPARQHGSAPGSRMLSDRIKLEKARRQESGRGGEV